MTKKSERAEEPLQKGRKTAGQDPVKRDQILDGAQKIFLRLGYDGASMNDITREAGVSKSTIYVYFSNKEDLFDALVVRQRERLFDKVWAYFDGPGTVADSLSGYGKLLAQKLCSEEVVNAHRTIIGVTERKPQMGRRFYDSGARRGLALLRQYLETQVTAGRLKIDDVELAAYQFSELCLAGLFRRRLLADIPVAPDDATIERTVHSAVRVFLAAYGTEEGQASAS